MTYFLGEIPTGLVYAILAMGIFISLRVLNVPDLTTEGSFGIGVILGSMAGLAVHPLLAIPVALLAGAVAGFVTGVLQTKLGVHPVLAGIITMSGLYSVNLLLIHVGSQHFTGVKSTNFYMKDATLFRQLSSLLGIEYNGVGGTLLKIGLLAVVLMVLVLLLTWFFSTNLGLALRATGNNADMVRASSINEARVKIIGLCLSNALVALSGAMLAQLQGFADFTSNSGALIRGLAAVILGGAILRHGKIPVGLCSATLGALLYQMLIALVVRYQIFGTNSSDLKNMTIAVVMALVLAAPAIRTYLHGCKLKRGGQTHA